MMVKRTVVRFYSNRSRTVHRDACTPSWTLLPLADGPAPERSDAARNREALLRAAQELIDDCGHDGVTMDAVAARAGVGKGTVFRRFESREGLMAALLNGSESAWQAPVMRGPPPLGPGRRRWTGCWPSATPGWSSPFSTPG